MKLNAHINFKGECEAAFKFYEKQLGGKIQFMMTYGAAPMKEKLPGFDNKIIHATLQAGDQLLTGADAPPNHYHQPQGFHLSLEIKDPAEADRVFRVLSEGGKVDLPIQETFWAKRFGMLVDRFGIPWMINCGKPTPEQSKS
jgi:PhnB protein